MLSLVLGLIGAAPTVLVAAVQYPITNASKVDPSCAPSAHRCAIEKLVRQAAKDGAKLVVTPEYAFTQGGPEAAPTVGPVAKREADSLLVQFSRLAAELKIHLVINLETREDDRRYNTQVAFGPRGNVVGKHHKFELFAAEGAKLSPGNDVTTFDTPFGRVGMIICADVYGDPRLHAKLTEELGARIIVQSSWWTVPDATKWPAAFAKDWGVYVIMANASDGEGRGGGIFAPDGRPLGVSKAKTPAVVLAPIPISEAVARRPMAPPSSGR